MLILALDTSTAQVSVAFGDHGEVLGAVQLAGGRRHAEQLAPAIDYLRRELAVDLGHVAAIAVGTGPGLFTGLRVGVTTAKVMAQALRIPVVGIPSLDLVAYPLRSSGRTIVAVLDARRREVFALVAGEATVLAPDTLQVEAGEICVGDGAVRYRALLEGNGAVVPPDDDERHRPRARFHAQLAGALGPVEAIEPLYLRAPDAKKSAR